MSIDKMNEEVEKMKEIIRIQHEAKLLRAANRRMFIDNATEIVNAYLFKKEEE